MPADLPHRLCLPPCPIQPQPGLGDAICPMAKALQSSPAQVLVSSAKGTLSSGGASFPWADPSHGAALQAGTPKAESMAHSRTREGMELQLWSLQKFLHMSCTCPVTTCFCLASMVQRPESCFKAAVSLGGKTRRLVVALCKGKQNQDKQKLLWVAVCSRTFAPGCQVGPGRVDANLFMHGRQVGMIPGWQQAEIAKVEQQYFLQNFNCFSFSCTRAC